MFLNIIQLSEINKPIKAMLINKYITAIALRYFFFIYTNKEYIFQNKKPKLFLKAKFGNWFVRQKALKNKAPVQKRSLSWTMKELLLCYSVYEELYFPKIGIAISSLAIFGNSKIWNACSHCSFVLFVVIYADMLYIFQRLRSFWEDLDLDDFIGK